MPTNLKCQSGNYQCGGRCQSNSKKCPSKLADDIASSADSLAKVVGTIHPEVQRKKKEAKAQGKMYSAPTIAKGQKAASQIEELQKQLEQATADVDAAKAKGGKDYGKAKTRRLELINKINQLQRTADRSVGK